MVKRKIGDILKPTARAIREKIVPDGIYQLIRTQKWSNESGYCIYVKNLRVGHHLSMAFDPGWFKRFGGNLSKVLFK